MSCALYLCSDGVGGRVVSRVFPEIFPVPGGNPCVLDRCCRSVDGHYDRHTFGEDGEFVAARFLYLPPRSEQKWGLS